MCLLTTVTLKFLCLDNTKAVDSPITPALCSSQRELETARSGNVQLEAFMLTQQRQHWFVTSSVMQLPNMVTLPFSNKITLCYIAVP
jgi:hypothetical protein